MHTDNRAAIELLATVVCGPAEPVLLERAT